MKNLLDIIAQLIALCAKLMGALRAVELSGDCDTCAKIVGEAEKEYLGALEEILDNKEEA